MYLEIQSQEVGYKKSVTFNFRETVRQYIVGFSNLTVTYGSEDHHVRELTIDLRDTRMLGKEIVVSPVITMRDSSENWPNSGDTKITVVVAALIGTNDEDMYMQSLLDPGAYSLPFISPAFLQAALSYGTISYQGSDHHLMEYHTRVNALPPSGNMFRLNGSISMYDNSNNNGTGSVEGSVIAYAGSNDRVMCGLIGDGSTNVILKENVGSIPSDATWQIGLFISSCTLSFGNEDHHVKKIELGLSRNGNPKIENGNLSLSVTRTANLCDDSSHSSSISNHNHIGGFVLAYYEKKQ